MNPLKIGVMVGSLRMDSFNRRLARAIEKLAPGDLAFRHIQINDLPLYSQDFDAAYPAVATRLKNDVETVDALLFATPEYNRSIPGVLKNAIDIASRPWGTNSFAGKPAAVVGTSIGSIGTAMAQQHLRNVLTYLDMPVLAQPEIFIHYKEGIFTEDGIIGNDGLRKLLQGFVDDYVAWVRRFAG